MYKIDNETAVSMQPPVAVPGPNVDGWFTEGDPNSGVPATIVTADWANTVQAELCNAIEGYGLTLDKANAGQLFDAMKVISRNAPYIASTTAANDYVVTPTVPVTALTEGLILFVKFTNHNTGAATLAVSGLTPAAIVNRQNAALAAGDILDGMIAELVYDGTNFQLINSGNYMNYGASTTAANAYTVNVTPTLITPLVEGTRFQIKFTNANTAAASLDINGIGAVNIKRPDGTALISGDIAAGMIASLVFDGTNLQLLNPNNVIRNTIVQVFTGSGTYTPSPGMIKCWIEVWAGGGGSAGAPATGVGQISFGNGGGGGGYAAGLFTAATIGASQVVTVGAVGTAGTAGAVGGAGGTSSVGALISATGGLGGATVGPFSSGILINVTGSAGGVGSNGSIQLTGGQAGIMNYSGTSSGQITVCSGGAGAKGSAGGAGASNFVSFAGNVGNTPGGGASGGVIQASTAAQVGKNGGAGLIIITEYCNQ